MTVSRKHAVRRDVGAIGERIGDSRNKRAAIADMARSVVDALSIAIENREPAGNSADIFTERDTYLFGGNRKRGPIGRRGGLDGGMGRRDASAKCENADQYRDHSSELSGGAGHEFSFSAGWARLSLCSIVFSPSQ